MTIDEAIRRINDHIDVHQIWRYPHIKLWEALRMAISALHAQQQAEKNNPLTMEELREMGGDPAWCKEYQCWGIVKYETIGHWANKPFFVGAWHDRGVAVDFEHDIEARGLTLYRHKPEEGEE